MSPAHWLLSNHRLLSCSTRQDGCHQLGRRLIGDKSLPPELAKDVGGKRNIGDDQRACWHHVRCDLPFQDTLELAHTAPFIGGGKPTLAGYDAAIGSDQNILHIAPRDIGASDLQPVDCLVDLVGEIDAVFGREQPAIRSV